MRNPYEKYLSMNDVPAGKILEVILKKKGWTQKELSLASKEYPQRINDYINGKRKFTMSSSFAIEKALQIEIHGFFMKIQCNHEIYEYAMAEERKIHPDLTKLSHGLFWDTRIEKINWNQNKEWVIQRTFEYGNPEEITEIIRFYGAKIVKEILQNIKSAWNQATRIQNYKKYLA